MILKYDEKCPIDSKTVIYNTCFKCEYYVRAIVSRDDATNNLIECDYSALQFLRNQHSVGRKLKKYAKEIMRLRNQVAYYKGRENGYNLTVDKLLKRNLGLSDKIRHLLKENFDLQNRS